MNLTLFRKYYTDLSTIGELFVEKDFFCHTLEDTCRRDGVKIHGRTAIPRGIYEVKILPSARYSRLMPRLLNVPNYDGILIHWGNKPADTDGCILVGNYNETIPNWISSSRITFDRLFERLTKSDGVIWITVEGGLDADRLAA